MVLAPGEKFCVILLGMGGPETVNDVGEFLFNIFSDREIIRLPGGPRFQKPLARMISKLRSGKVSRNYAAIGGGSPLLRWTQAQKENIENTLAPIHPGFAGFVGMRYFRPTMAHAVGMAIKAGYQKIVFLPMYPQYCKATTGSSFAEARRVLKSYQNVEASFIDDFHDLPGYTSLLKTYIDENIGDGETLLFSAHSIPQKFVDEGDPYVEQVKKTVALAAGERDYCLSFQSRTGPVKWVGPNTVAEATRLAGEGKRLFVVPVSFLCDHIETLSEIDIELAHHVKARTGKTIRRMPMFNDDARLGTALANLILNKVRVHAG